MARFYSNPGSRWHNDYVGVVDERGIVSLVPNGRTDIQRLIDAFREATDLSVIKQRMLAGDTSVVNVNQPFYTDLSRVPTTMAGMLQLQVDAQHAFYQLPVTVREQFHNSLNEFIQASASDDFLRRLGVVADPVSPVPTTPPEVTPDDE